MTNPTSTIPSSDYHIPVLFHETMQYLNIQPDGVYVDALDYALMQGDLTEKQEKMFEQAMNILHPDEEDYEA